jgi:hypothetical protein
MGESGSANWLKRIVLGFGLLLILVVCVALAVSYYFRKLVIEHLKSAVVEADELDPGWRWEDLEKKRAAVPDAENAALRVEAAHKLPLPMGSRSSFDRTSQDRPRLTNQRFHALRRTIGTDEDDGNEQGSFVLPVQQ